MNEFELVVSQCVLVDVRYSVLVESSCAVDRSTCASDLLILTREEVVVCDLLILCDGAIREYDNLLTLRRIDALSVAAGLKREKKHKQA